MNSGITSEAKGGENGEPDAPRAEAGPGWGGVGLIYMCERASGTGSGAPSARDTVGTYTH